MTAQVAPETAAGSLYHSLIMEVGEETYLAPKVWDAANALRVSIDTLTATLKEREAELARWESMGVRALPFLADVEGGDNYQRRILCHDIEHYTKGEVLK